MIDVAYVEKGTDYQEDHNVFILRHLHNPLLSVCTALSRNILSLQNWVSVIVLRNYISTSTGHNVGAPLRRKVLFTTTKYRWYRELGILFLSHISLPVNVEVGSVSFFCAVLSECSVTSWLCFPSFLMLTWPTLPFTEDHLLSSLQR